jgi:hypothetical protein
MIDSEKIVRAAWLRPWGEGHNPGVFPGYEGCITSDDADRAVAFTLEHAEQIRQKVREIEALCQNSYAGRDDYAQTLGGYSGERLVNRIRHHHQLCRILSTLQQQYADLTRGMKSEWVESVTKGVQQ